MECRENKGEWTEYDGVSLTGVEVIGSVDSDTFRVRGRLDLTENRVDDEVYLNLS